MVEDVLSLSSSRRTSAPEPASLNLPADWLLRSRGGADGCGAAAARCAEGQPCVRSSSRSSRVERKAVLVLTASCRVYPPARKTNLVADLVEAYIVHVSHGWGVESANSPAPYVSAVPTPFSTTSTRHSARIYAYLRIHDNHAILAFWASMSRGSTRSHEYRQSFATDRVVCARPPVRFRGGANARGASSESS